MNEPRYTIILNGTPLPSVSEQAMHENLARLFKTTPEKARAMTAKGPRVLKNDLTLAQADRYLAALNKAGAVAYKEATQNSGGGGQRVYPKTMPPSNRAHRTGANGYNLPRLTKHANVPLRRQPQTMPKHAGGENMANSIRTPSTAV